MGAGSPAEPGTNLFGHGDVRYNRVVLPRWRGGTTGWQTGAHSCRRASVGMNAQFSRLYRLKLLVVLSIEFLIPEK
jgi:hypothetical protein